MGLRPEVLIASRQHIAFLHRETVMLGSAQTLARDLGCKGLRVRAHGMAYSLYKRDKRYCTIEFLPLILVWHFVTGCVWICARVAMGLCHGRVVQYVGANARRQQIRQMDGRKRHIPSMSVRAGARHGVGVDV